MSESIILAFGVISIEHERVYLSSPAFKLQIPFDNSLGNIGITLPNI